MLNRKFIEVSLVSTALAIQAPAVMALGDETQGSADRCAVLVDGFEGNLAPFDVDVTSVSSCFDFASNIIYVAHHGERDARIVVMNDGEVAATGMCRRDNRRTSCSLD